jgi:hypothetical protein
MTDRKKPGVAFWATVVMVVVLVGYPLSFGPVCWISERTGIGCAALSVAYQPMLRLWVRKTYLGATVSWYATVGTKSGRYTIHKLDGGSLSIDWQGMRN